MGAEGGANVFVVAVGVATTSSVRRSSGRAFAAKALLKHARRCAQQHRRIAHVFSRAQQHQRLRLLARNISIKTGR